LHQRRPRRHQTGIHPGALADSHLPAPRLPRRTALPRADAAVDWGRLILGQTFGDPAGIIAALRAEEPGRRDIAAYVADHHVVLALAPQELFLDPSDTYRLDLGAWRPAERAPAGFAVRPLETASQAREANRIYAARAMLPTPDDFLMAHRDCPHLAYLVAAARCTRPSRGRPWRRRGRSRSRWSGSTSWCRTRPARNTSSPGPTPGRASPATSPSRLRSGSSTGCSRGRPSCGVAGARCTPTHPARKRIRET
jgi:hypothetical protein